MKKNIYRLLLISLIFFQFQACASRPPISEQHSLSATVIEKNADLFVLALYDQKLEKVLELSQTPFYLNHRGILSQKKDWMFTLNNMYKHSKPAQLTILSRQLMTPQILFSQYPDVYALMIETGFENSFFVYTELQAVNNNAQSREKVVLIINPATGLIQGFFIL